MESSWRDIIDTKTNFAMDAVNNGGLWPNKYNTRKSTSAFNTYEMDAVNNGGLWSK